MESETSKFRKLAQRKKKLVLLSTASTAVGGKQNDVSTRIPEYDRLEVVISQPDQSVHLEA
jgi:hypothetical protein